MVLRRQTAVNAYTPVTLNGVTVRFAPEELRGDIREGDWQVWITNDEIAAASWPAPPAPRDTLVIDGRAWQVQGCESLYEGANVAGYRLHVRGG